ncbi:MAG: ABC transporter ATP-binding protein [Lachnospiraceae bacterium]|nr:ABC transporter ATP-binding protein [Lachnospiraceae bacterium]
MNLYKELSYLFDRKLKLKFVGMVFVVLFGAIAELCGVYVILPVVELATDPEAVQTNRYCRWISDITGLSESNDIMLVLIACIIGLYIVKNVYLTFQAYAINSFSKNTRLHFSTKLMEAYMKQPYSYFLNKNTAEILRSVSTDTGNMYTVITNLLQIISQGLTAVLLITGLLLTSFWMTVMVTGVLALCALIIILVLQKKMRSLGLEYQRVGAGIIKAAKQAFEGIKEIKIMNRERFFIESYRTVYKNATRVELIYNLMRYIPKYLIETITIGGILLYLAIVILGGGNMGALLPQLSLFAVAAFKLLPSINTLYSDYGNVIYNKASVDLIYHDIREVQDTADEAIAETKAEKLCFEREITIDSLSFAYDNTDHYVLEDISFSIEKGKSVAFIGESGGGKTTLVDNILGVLKPQKGSVLVDGVNINEIMQSWHHDIGYIPQTIFIMDDTVRRNVAFGVKDKDIDDELVWEALKEAQLESFVRQMEHGLDTEVGEAGMRLSGGQRQRIGIARALYHNPDILVFDEATSALDNETEKEVMAAIDALHGSKTMLMIAHRLTTIENCDCVYRVENRKLEKVR